MVVSIPGVTDDLSRITSISQGQEGPGFGRFGQQDIYRVGANQPTGGQILGAFTDVGGGGGGGGGGGAGGPDPVVVDKANGAGGGDSELAQLLKMGNRNPSQESRYQEIIAGQAGADRAGIDEAYAGLFGEFGKQEGLVRQGAEAGKGDVESRYSTDAEKYTAELDKMLRDIGINKSEFLKSVSDAISQNVEDFNALSQRSNVRYGGGSSVGDLMKELATKELFKQQGLTRREKASGETKFASLMQDANTFVSQKMGDLDQWKREALGKIEGNLQSQLAGISASRQQTETEKANAKLGILQQARAQAQQIGQMDAQIRTEFASAYVANLQEISGRTMTPEEVQGIYSQFADINFRPYGQAFEEASSPNLAALSPEDEDEFKQLFS